MTNQNLKSRIVFFENRNFMGRSYECSSDCPDLFAFLSRCHSCKVEAGCFVLYDRTNYTGNQHFLRKGEHFDYQTMRMTDGLRSCRVVPLHKGSYKMKIYEREGLGGQAHEISEDCDNIAERYRMTSCMSCHVTDGHWLMYELPHFRGRMMYLRPGEYRHFSLGMGSMGGAGGMGGLRFTSMRRIGESGY
ncbi:gamma-crystallin M3 [Esox lucius]|uniref:Beta/gamma crystallin 'Greek key' domain-containing protein n=1 Tax=Esox lucius TaxID=8010 RepID=A0A3P8XQ07_ESOLU|nr:gamma-crystallin M3 [Esox lucius]